MADMANEIKLLTYVDPGTVGSDLWQPILTLWTGAIATRFSAGWWLTGKKADISPSVTCCVVWGRGLTEVLSLCRLGIEIAKTMSLNYSNQETSVTIGESVRDEDGTL